MTDPTPQNERLLWALQERAKELRCLYEIEELLNRPETPLEDVFHGVIRAIPPGWQYPEVCQASVEYEGETYAPPEFAPTSWVQSADMVVQGRVVGRVNVQYTREMPLADEGPFLAEEGRLIRTIADRLGHFVLHQRLRTLVTELHDAQKTLVTENASEWRVALHLLRRTDQELYVRLARKTANHLSWSGIQAAQSLMQGLGLERMREEEDLLGEHNEPSRLRPLDASLELADRVFELAGRHFADAELLMRIQSWIHADRGSFLVKAALDPRSSPVEIADAIRRYLHLVPEGVELELSLLANVRAALIRRFLSEEPRYVSVARRVLGLEDLLHLLDRLIHLPGSIGRVGGKAAGLFLAHRLLQQPAADGSPPLEVSIPKSWFVATDCSPAFIRYNNLEEVFEQKYKPSDQVRLQYPHLVQVFKNSAFPPELVQQPVGGPRRPARRTAHRAQLEPPRGPAGIGVLGQVHAVCSCSNRGPRRERLEALLDAIAEVYASIFGPDPIQYRAERGLLDSREEMGILIQEVVGPAGRPWYFSGLRRRRDVAQRVPLVAAHPPRGRADPARSRSRNPGRGSNSRRLPDASRTGAAWTAGQRRPPTKSCATRPNGSTPSTSRRALCTSIDAAPLLRSHGNEYPQVHRIVSLVEDDRIVKPTGRWIGLRGQPRGGDLRGTGRRHRLHRPSGRDPEIAGRPVSGTRWRSSSPRTATSSTSCSVGRRATPPTATPGAVAPRRPRRADPVHRQSLRLERTDRRHHAHRLRRSRRATPIWASWTSLRAVGRAVSQAQPRAPQTALHPHGSGSLGEPRRHQARGERHLLRHQQHRGLDRNGAPPRWRCCRTCRSARISSRISSRPRFGICRSIPDDAGVTFNDEFFRNSPNELEGLLPEFARLAGVLRVIDVARASGGKILRVFLNAELDAAMGVLCEPGGVDAGSRAGHRPRLPGARTTGAGGCAWPSGSGRRSTPRRFGVAALYLIGSVKNANAGPGSDIDLLVHFRGDAAQRADLDLWLRGWSECLDEVNYLRTGTRAGGLLDVHFVTDADIAARTSFAVKIGAVTDAAWPLPLKPG